MPSLIEISAELSRLWPELNADGPINREERIRAIIVASLNAQTKCSFCGCVFNTDTDECRKRLKDHIATCDKSPLVQTIIAAQSLVAHMWVHSAYKNNGYLQMTTEQKVMYCAAIGAEFDPLEPKRPIMGLFVKKDTEPCQTGSAYAQQGDAQNLKTAMEYITKLRAAVRRAADVFGTTEV